MSNRQYLSGKTNNVLASNNNNFVKGGDVQPTLISLDDATTLFHDFGHALHYPNYDITFSNHFSSTGPSSLPVAER